MTTALQLITGSLRLIGALAEGETPSANQANDSLVSLNQMIDSWSTERLSVFCTQDQVFTWPSSERSRTFGPTGQITGTRPVRVDEATYFKVNNLSYSLILINQDQYNGIALKGSTSTYPNVMFVNMTMPDIEMYLYPVPTSALEFHLVSVQQLTQPATLATNLVFPPGYERALKYALAMEVAPEYGIEPLPQVKRIAMTSKRTLKRINNPDDIMAMPYSLIARNQRFNIFAPTY